MLKNFAIYISFGDATYVFCPQLFNSFGGHNRALFAKDVLAGLTVGVVAIPLAMAVAIASGLKPEAGIFTAIIAGGLISMLGGSRIQIGGPAGAFIVIVYGIVERYGVPNLLLATAMSGGIFIFDGRISSRDASALYSNRRHHRIH